MLSIGIHSSGLGREALTNDRDEYSISYTKQPRLLGEGVCSTHRVGRCTARAQHIDMRVYSGTLFVSCDEG